jgi:hypothetical protein
MFGPAVLQLVYVCLFFFFFDKKIWRQLVVFFLPSWWSYQEKSRVVQSMLCLNGRTMRKKNSAKILNTLIS